MILKMIMLKMRIRFLKFFKKTKLISVTKSRKHQRLKNQYNSNKTHKRLRKSLM